MFSTLAMLARQCSHRSIASQAAAQPFRAARTMVLTTALLLLLAPLTYGVAIAHNPLESETRADCVTDDQASQYLIVEAGQLTCRAVMAIYVDENGHLLWLENVRDDPRRLIHTIPQIDSEASGCIGGSKCFVCNGSRCGCIC